MEPLKKFEMTLATELVLRGLRRAPGGLAFIHDGHAVRVTVSESLYRGLVVTLHEPDHRTRQFRARDGAHDWDAIAEAIVDIVARVKGAASTTSASDGAAHSNGFSIRPSPTTPGRVRVRLSETELDAVSAMQLYALLQRALPTPGRERAAVPAMAY